MSITGGIDNTPCNSQVSIEPRVKKNASVDFYT
jgi:hypothetical protein